MARITPRAARGRFAVALWILAVAILAAAVIAWVVGEIAARQEADRVDARLAGSVRAAQTDFETALTDAASTAERLARSQSAQRALARGDRRSLARLAEMNEGTAFFKGGRLLAGQTGSPARRVGDVGRDFSAVLELWTPPEADRAATIAKKAEWAAASVRAARQWINQ